MSTSVLVKAQVYSFATRAGGVGYVWAEKTYDTKDGKEAANWDVMAIGSRSRILDRIFTVAHNIPGGSTQVSHPSPQGFISSMMSLLSKPILLDDTTINLTQHGSNKCIHDGNRESVFGQLQLHGIDIQKSGVLEGGSVEIDLSTHLGLVETLTAPGGISPWKLYPSKPMAVFGQGPKEEVTSRVSQRRAAPAVSLYKLPVESGHGDCRLWLCRVEEDEGQATLIDELWAVQSRLLRLAGEREGASPGYYKGLMAGFDKARDAQLLYAGQNPQTPKPPEFCPETEFSIDASLAGESQQKRVCELSLMLDGQPSTTLAFTVQEAQQAIMNATPQDPEKRQILLYRLSSILSDPDITSVQDLKISDRATPEQHARPRAQ